MEGNDFLKFLPFTATNIMMKGYINFRQCESKQGKILTSGEILEFENSLYRLEGTWRCHILGP